MTKLRYTKEELLEIIKAKAEELGRTPFHAELSQAATISKRFGSWDKALEAAGLSSSVNRKKYTKEELLDILKAKAEELGRTPFKNKLTQRVTITKRFGSWEKALEAAGLNVRNREKYTKEELLGILKAKAKELGRTPCKTELSQGRTIATHFGSWEKALEAAGLDIKRKSSYTSEELLDILKAKAEELGRAPYINELIQGDTIIKRFGSWEKALETVGLSIKHKYRYTEEELLEIIKAKAKELGRTPLRNELPQGGTITKHFGSWEKALETIGMEIKYKYSYTKEELLEIIKAKAEELGRAPFGYEISQHGTVIKNFGSWEKALEACCLQKEKRKAEGLKKYHVENTHLGLISSQKLSRTNTSGVKGVSWSKRKGKWRAYMRFQGKDYRLGYFDKIEDAAKARKEAEEKYFKPIIEKYKYKSPSDTDPV